MSNKTLYSTEHMAHIHKHWVSMASNHEDKRQSLDHSISPVTQITGFHSAVSGSDHWSVLSPTAHQKQWPPIELTQHYFFMLAGQEIIVPPFQSCSLLSCFGTELGPPLILTCAVLLFASDPALLFSIAFTVTRNTKKSIFLQSYVKVRTVCLVSASLVKSGSTEYLTNSQMLSIYRSILSALCVSDFLFNLTSHSFPCVCPEPS